MDKLFTLKINLHFTPGTLIVITAWDRLWEYPKNLHDSHSYIDIEVRHGGKVIFPRGQLYCGVNAWTATDGIKAKELVMSTVAMKPGDTEEEYFKNYTPEQWAWAIEFGEALSVEAASRYCDEDGDVRDES